MWLHTWPRPGGLWLPAEDEVVDPDGGEGAAAHAAGGAAKGPGFPPFSFSCWAILGEIVAISAVSELSQVHVNRCAGRAGGAAEAHRGGDVGDGPGGA